MLNASIFTDFLQPLSKIIIQLQFVSLTHTDQIWLGINPLASLWSITGRDRCRDETSSNGPRRLYLTVRIDVTLFGAGPIVWSYREEIADGEAMTTMQKRMNIHNKIFLEGNLTSVKLLFPIWKSNLGNIGHSPITDVFLSKSLVCKYRNTLRAWNVLAYFKFNMHLHSNYILLALSALLICSVLPLNISFELFKCLLLILIIFCLTIALSSLFYSFLFMVLRFCRNEYHLHSSTN